MEVVQLSEAIQDTDLNYDSTCSTPYITAPSSPHLRINTITDYHGDDQNDEEFAFDFSGKLLDDKSSVFAEELFDKGKIKPLKFIPTLKSIINGDFEFEESKSDIDDDQVQFMSSISSPRSPISQRNRNLKESFAPPKKSLSELDKVQLQINHGGIGESKHEFDDDPVTFISAISSPRSPISQRKEKRSSDFDPFEETLKAIMSVSPSNSKSTLRVSDILSEPDTDKAIVKKYSFFSSFSISKAYRKMKSSNSRSSEHNHGNDVGSVSKRRNLAAHEMHIAAYRAAAAEEKKRKTYLPYKQGLLGCLGHNPAVHDVSRTTGSLTRV